MGFGGLRAFWFFRIWSGLSLGLEEGLTSSRLDIMLLYFLSIYDVCSLIYLPLLVALIILFSNGSFVTTNSGKGSSLNRLP